MVTVVTGGVTVVTVVSASGDRSMPSDDAVGTAVIWHRLCGSG